MGPKRTIDPRKALETVVALQQASEVFLPLDYPGARLEILVRSMTEYYVRTQSCRREPATVRWLESLKAGEVLFDVGANIGAYSLIAASRRKGIRVFAFEPHYANFNSLCRNIVHNGLAEAIVPAYMALGAKTAIGEFNHWDDYRKGESGSSGHQLNRALTEEEVRFKPVLRQRIPAMALSDFCGLYSVTPDAVKIDVDGIESEVVEGAAPILAARRIRTLLIEVNRKSARTIDARMRRFGYRLRTVSENNNHIYTRS